MSLHNNYSGNEAPPSLCECIALKEELRTKEKEIRDLKESNTKINDLEKKIEKLEEERNALKERLIDLEGRVDHLEKENATLEMKIQERDSLSSTPATVTEAYLWLGALCDSVQTMMYKHVFHRKSHPPSAVYKVKDIENNLAKGGTIATERWNVLQKKLKWNPERHLEAITHCKRSRNKCAHPDAQLTEESLTKSVELLKSKGELPSGWVSLQDFEDLKTMWELLRK